GASALLEGGTRVLMLQPAEQDVALMGFNLMSGGRRLEVMEQARRSVANELRGIRDRGAPLPERTAPARRRRVRAADRPARGRRRAASRAAARGRSYNGRSPGGLVYR